MASWQSALGSDHAVASDFIAFLWLRAWFMTSPPKSTKPGFQAAANSAASSQPTVSPPPTSLGFRYWWGQLWGVMRKALMFSFAGLGIVLLAKFGGKATVIILPVLVLLFGTGLYGWLRVKMRKKK